MNKKQSNKKENIESESAHKQGRDPNKFESLFMTADYILYGYKRRKIILPTEGVCVSEDDIQSLFMISSAFYEDTEEIISTSDAKDLKEHLKNKTAEIGVPLLIE